MPAKPKLGQRAIVAYNRLSRDVAALNYVLRIAKPKDTAGERTLRDLNMALRTANRLFAREASQPSFKLLDPIVPLSNADFLILVTRLTAATQAFEERYAHLTGETDLNGLRAFDPPQTGSGKNLSPPRNPAP